MPQSDSAAVNIELFKVLGAVPATNGGRDDGLGGKCLVGLNKRHIVSGKSGFLKECLGSVTCAQTHGSRVYTHATTGNVLCQRCDAKLLSFFLTHENKCSSAVVDA